MSLKELRKSKGFSQSQLSRLSGVSVRMIQYYEQGRNDINNTSAITVYHLCKALDCSFEDILNISDDL